MTNLHRPYLIAIAALLFICCGNSNAQEVAKPTKTIAALEAGKEEVRVVCFGDSITGVYYHSGGRRAYTDMLGIALQRSYPNAKIKMINAGISGHTTVNALQRIQKDVLAHKPHLVTIKFGMNDVTRVPLDQFRKNTNQIIDLCEGVGAEVVLCATNAVLETPRRPSAKLIEYCDVVRDIAKERKLPLADVYVAYDRVRQSNLEEFHLLMSDEIHPNMDGHELIATTIAESISGKTVSLADVQPPMPALPKLKSLLKSGEEIKVLAMPPLDKEIQSVIQELGFTNKVVVIPWLPKANTIGDFAAAASQARKAKPDLALLYIPADVAANDRTHLVRTFSRVLSYSLSFGYQEWDFVAVAPDVIDSASSDKNRGQANLIGRIVKAGDLNLIERAKDDERSYQKIISSWLQNNLKPE